jgi:hypothetical protein
VIHWGSYGPKMHIFIREAVEHYVNPLNSDMVASKASGLFSVHIPMLNLRSTLLPTSTTPFAFSVSHAPLAIGNRKSPNFVPKDKVMWYRSANLSFPVKLWGLCVR